MKLEIIEPIDKVGYYDRVGKYRSTQGCSLVGLGEFRRWLEILSDLVGQYSVSEECKNFTYADLYVKSSEDADNISPVLATACDRILELNGIDPDWVTPSLLSRLLFNYIDDNDDNEQPKPGLLIALNYPDRVAESTNQEPEGDPIANAIATLTKVTSGLGEAIEIANTHSWKPVSQIVNAIADQQKKESGEGDAEPTRPPTQEEIDKMISQFSGKRR
jgi:hypothetical protein